MWKKFKEFAFKGNALDLAIGVVIGTAFKEIVTALVDKIIMPAIGILTGGKDFSTLVFTFKDATIEYGAFIQAVVDFFIIALSLFVMITVIGKIRDAADKLHKKQEEEAPAEPPAPTETELLTEIRDLLKNK
ncbi:MAG: large conductance mechanosensitive channel protein MscL [Clostridia bacterium]|nr:large conductance mechanosensitive channel protein MscL [Clostridia bacterium]MBR3593049.1 large conductance mechanosensitive channel protein MscL [Clostridia bacterium]